MSETFVPLVPVTAKSREAVFASINQNGATPMGAQSNLTAPRVAGSGSETCSNPVVTLQRTGEIVSGIRIQCGCGQVVDLACVY